MRKSVHTILIVTTTQPNDYSERNKELQELEAQYGSIAFAHAKSTIDSYLHPGYNPVHIRHYLEENDTTYSNLLIFP